MKFHYIEEPDLVFARGLSPCPRAGISRHDVYDARYEDRHDRIIVGGVGTNECLEKLAGWLELCRLGIPAKESRQPNLFPAFCGFQPSFGFKAEIRFSDRMSRAINNSEILDLLKLPPEQCVEKAVELYLGHITFLVQNRPADVVVCVIPNELFAHLSRADSNVLESEDADSIESNFRRALKARAMHLGKPLQLVIETTLDHSPKGHQDDATRAWNFCTALYYKSHRTIPWRLIDNQHKPTVCYIGIGFYRSRDRSVLNTSLAQVFDELGNGVILRGDPVFCDKEDRHPYLKYDQAADLLRRALREYRRAMDTSPSRLVLHKSSNFREEEVDGFRDAMQDERVTTSDFVTIMNTPLRLLRKGGYPPLRGSHVELDDLTHLLYTRGSVPFYRTYPGDYVPQAIEVRIVKGSDQSPRTICSEILALTKMNWNNTQFDGRLPITIQCARKVGEIMKYLGPEDRPSSNYSFYM